MKSSFTLSTPTSINPLTNSEFSTRLLWILGLTALVIFNIDSLSAIEIVDLRAPMLDLKKQVWGWMFPVKIAGVFLGSVMSLKSQSLMPFAIGAGVAAGIQIFDSLIGDGSTALI